MADAGCVRIEDLDRPREVPGSAAGILSTLEQFGFEWDGSVARQSERNERYEAALQSLAGSQLDLCLQLQPHAQLEDELRYPGTCRERALASGTPSATRLRIEPGQVIFHDRIQGTYRQDVAGAVGDIILKRRDQILPMCWRSWSMMPRRASHTSCAAPICSTTRPGKYTCSASGDCRSLRYAHVPVLTEAEWRQTRQIPRSVQLRRRFAAAAACARSFPCSGSLPRNPCNRPRSRKPGVGRSRQWDLNRVPKRLNLRVNG